MTNHLRKTILRCVVATLALTSYQLWAQEAALDEIIVTAQKREENLQDVSISVTAISGADLVRARVTQLEQLDALVPGLQWHATGGDVGFAMRGAVTAQVEANDPSISFYTDGIVRPRHGMANASLVDMERIEVLRGPQGTLFGRNSYGGAINVISNKPELGETDVGIGVTAGNYNLLRTEGFVNFPLGDSAALRVTGVDETRDPYVENTAIGKTGGLKDADYSYLRAQLLVQTSDNVSVVFRAESWEDHSQGSSAFGYKPLGCPIDSNGLTNGVDGTFNGFIGEDPGGAACGKFGAGNGAAPPDPLFGSGNTPTNPDPYQIQTDIEPFRDISESTFATTLDFTGSDVADLKVTLAYIDYEEIRWADNDFSPYDSQSAGNEITSSVTSQEFTFSSKGDGRLQWTAGLYFLQEDLDNVFLFMDHRGAYGIDIYSLDPATNAPDLTIPVSFSWASFMQEIRIETRSQAVYGQGTFAVTDNFRLVAGLRYTDDERDWDIWGLPGVTFGFCGPQSLPGGSDPGCLIGDSEIYGNYPGDVSVLRFSQPLLLDSHHTWDNTDWRAGLEFGLGENAMAYATASTGFLSGNAKSAFDGGDTYDQRTVEAIEIGLKSTLADGRLRLNIAVYDNQYEDLLGTTFRVVGGTVLATQDNAGDSEATGIEIEADWAPSDQWYLGLRMNVQDATYVNFTQANQFEAGGIDNPAPLTGQHFVMDGKQVRNSPDLTMTFLLSYDIDMGDKGTLTPYLTIYYSDDYVTFDRPFFYSQQESFTKSDFSLNWVSRDGDWTAQAFVRNIEDEATLTDTTVFGQNLAIADYDAPRMYGFRLAYNF